MKVILYHLTSYCGDRGGAPFEGVVWQKERLGIVYFHVSVVSSHVWIVCLFLLLSLISIVAFIVCCLISLMFPVNLSCLNPWSLLFVKPPTLLSILLQEEVWEGAVIEQHMVWSVSVGALNWGIPFWNHNTRFHVRALKTAVLNTLALILRQALSWEEL